jgi:flagellar protein FliO/FliZ
MTSPVRITHALAGAFATLLLAAPVALAATPQSERTPLDLGSSEQAAQASGGGGGIARMVVGLAVVLGVIYGLSWVLKQVRASREAAAVGGGLQAVSTLPLGPNRSLHLVRVGSDLVLLGAAEKGITPIRGYDVEQARAAGLLDDAADADADGEVVEVADVPQLPAGPAPSLLDALRARTVRR